MNTNINAVLVKLSIGLFPNARQDRELTEALKKHKAMSGNVGRWTKYKLPPQCLDPISKFVGEVRTFHYNHTSPWEDGAFRLISAKARAKYDERMDAYAAEFNDLVEAFGQQYPAWIEQAKINHNGTFDPADYPVWSEARKTFFCVREYLPVPQSSHFTVEMKALYGSALDVLVESKISDAVADTWKRLLEPVNKLAEKLASKDAIFRDSLVDNIKEMVGLVPELNITNDTGLKEAAKVISDTLAGLSPEALRENKVLRQDVAEKAKTLAERFGTMGSRKLAA